MGQFIVGIFVGLVVGVVATLYATNYDNLIYVEESFCNGTKAEVWWFQKNSTDKNLEKRFRCVPK